MNVVDKQNAACQRAMRLSLIASILMLGGKISAYLITGSSAIFSDAAESVIHIFATGIAAFSLWYTHRPADRDHLYGHGKIVYFSAGFEGALILSAALVILYSCVSDLIRGPSIKHLDWGLLITGVLTLINLGLGVLLVRTGKKHNSFVLIANGRHVLTDMWTSAGVIVGVAIVWMTGIAWLDPVTGIVVGLQILYTAFMLIRDSFYGLTDRVDPEKTATFVAALNHAVQEGLIKDFHQFRYRRSDDQVWIEVHFLMPGTLTTSEAHRRGTLVEESLRRVAETEQVWITSHIEPDDHDVSAHPGGHSEEDPLLTGELR